MVGGCSEKKRRHKKKGTVNIYIYYVGDAKCCAKWCNCGHAFEQDTHLLKRSTFCSVKRPRANILEKRAECIGYRGVSTLLLSRDGKICEREGKRERKAILHTVRALRDGCSCWTAEFNRVHAHATLIVVCHHIATGCGVMPSAGFPFFKGKPHTQEKEQFSYNRLNAVREEEGKAEN